MLGKIHTHALAVATLAEAVVAFLLAIGVMSPEVGAGVTGVIAGAMLVIRSFVSPVAKTARLLGQPVEAVNDLLGKVKL